jgi:hypothetical protein
MKREIYIFTALLYVLFSCTEKDVPNNAEKISIDFNNIQSIDLSDTDKIKIIPLQTTDVALLSLIQSVDIVDDRIIVFDGNNVFVFDEKGKYLHKIGRVGHGPGEYQDITNIFIEDQNICLFDFGAQKVLIYDKNGQYISSQALDRNNSVTVIYPVDRHEYIAKNSYRGNNNKVSSLSFWDSTFNKIRDINGLYLSSGSFDANYLYSYEHNILYWEFLNDTIFSIQNNKIIPKYVVDFSKYAIPKSIKRTNDAQKIIEYANQSSINVATLVKFVQTDSSYVRFAFLQKENTVNSINYVRFDTNAQNAKTRRIIDSSKRYNINYFFLFHNGNIIVSLSDTENEEDNPSLAFIKEDDYY